MKIYILWFSFLLLSLYTQSCSVAEPPTLVYLVFVAGVEEVKVPAGTFQTLKVEYYNPNSGKLGAEYWYSPKVKWIVKSRIYRRDGVREAELIGYKAD